MKLKDLTRKILYEEYVVKKRTLAQIAESWGCTLSTVYSGMLKFKIPRRPPGSEPLDKLKNLTREMLNNKYWKQKQSIARIAEDWGCSPDTIYQRMVKWDIPRRELTGENNPNFGRTGYWSGKKRPEMTGENSPMKRTENRAKMTGENNPLWKSVGYVSIRLEDPKHPRAYIKTPNGWVLRSRLVMEEKIGRKLEPSELVHHRNGDTMEDDPLNLQVLSNGEHSTLHNIQRHLRKTFKSLIEKRKALEFPIPERRSQNETRKTENCRA